MKKYNLSFAVDNDKLFINIDELHTLIKLVCLLKKTTYFTDIIKKEINESDVTFDPDLDIEYLFCLKEILQDILNEFNLEFKILVNQTFLEVKLNLNTLNNLNMFTTVCKVKSWVVGYARVEIPDYIFNSFKSLSSTINQAANITTKDSYIYDIKDKPSFILFIHDFLKVISES